ncbi:GAF domain-containing sensor histidine kinase [Amycolatopsis pigmentata]|uniref:GAF domain-containing sensor histidine kinase n=1 Tax=Amycolatopsis pigmentata TaxID=450801 RepID=A0ABW5FQ31_9PSEU
MNRIDDRSSQRERWLTASRQVTAALLSGGDFAGTLQMIAEQARSVSRSSVGAIARPAEHDPETLVFEVIASPDPEHTQLINVTVPVENTATGLAFASSEPVVVRQYGAHVVEQQGGAVPDTVKDLDSAVAVPLTVGSETLGVVLMARFEDLPPFTDDEIELVRDFAVHAALTMEFARAQDDRHRVAVLEDRNRIGRDLHDLVVQRLYAIGLGLSALGRPELTPFVRDVDETIREIRTTILSLQEPAGPNALRSELLRLARDSARSLGFQPRVGFDGPLEAAITGPLRMDVIAALRESLANVVRHAGATSVSVEAKVDRAGRRFTLIVTDNGIGPPDELPHYSGLANLTGRAARWNGTCSLEDAPVRGARLTWTAEAR